MTQYNNLIHNKHIFSLHYLSNPISKANLRPSIRDLYPEVVRDVIRQCWDADPARRPSCGQVTKWLATRRPSKQTVIESMMETLEGYVTILEDKVQVRH